MDSSGTNNFAGLMARIAAGAAGYLLVLLSLLGLVLSLIPLLFPAVLAVSLVVITISIVVLLYYERKYADTEPGTLKAFLPLRLFFERYGFRDMYRKRRLSRLAFLSMRIGAFSILTCVLFYIFLSAHSWACYIAPLNSELEPIRKKLRILARQEGIPGGGKSAKGASVGKPGPSVNTPNKKPKK